MSINLRSIAVGSTKARFDGPDEYDARVSGLPVEALYVGYHLLIVDLFPPAPRDPQGLHGAIWSMISDEPFELPPGRPLTLASYSSGPSKRAFVEPTAIDRKLIDMPLFLEPEMYVNVPLEPTYQEAYRG